MSHPDRLQSVEPTRDARRRNFGGAPQRGMPMDAGGMSMDGFPGGSRASIPMGAAALAPGRAAARAGQRRERLLYLYISLVIR